MTFSPSRGLLRQSMADRLDSPLQNLLALSLPAEVIPAYCNRLHRPEVNATWAVCRGCTRERTWVVLAPKDSGHHLGLTTGILLIRSELAASPVHSDVGELGGARLGCNMEPHNSFAERVTHHLSH